MMRSVGTADQLLEAKRSGKTGVIKVAPDDTVEHALQLMAEKDIGAVVVTENDKLVGLMSERDYARKVEIQGGASARTKLVREIMTRDIIPAKPADSVETCRRLMNDNQTEKAKCSYDIVLLDEDTKASWGLVNELIHENSGASSGYCLKTGNLFRVEAPAEKAKRMVPMRAEIQRLEQIEADRRNKEMQAETDRKNREKQAETDRQNAAKLTTAAKATVLVFYRVGRAGQANSIAEALRKSGYTSSATLTNLLEVVREVRADTDTNPGAIVAAVAGNNTALGNSIRAVVEQTAVSARLTLQYNWEFKASEAQLYVF